VVRIAEESFACEALTGTSSAWGGNQRRRTHGKTLFA